MTGYSKKYKEVWTSLIKGKPKGFWGEFQNRVQEPVNVALNIVYLAVVMYKSLVCEGLEIVCFGFL